jgi:hypothetical protein
MIYYSFIYFGISEGIASFLVASFVRGLGYSRRYEYFHYFQCYFKAFMHIEGLNIVANNCHYLSDYYYFLWLNAFWSLDTFFISLVHYYVVEEVQIIHCLSLSKVDWDLIS